MRWVTLALTGALLSGCGSYLVLEVDCDYAVPDEVDTLDLQVMDPDSQETLGQFVIPLTAGETFPVELLVEPAAQSPSPLRILVVARLCGGSCGDEAVSVAQGEALVTWEAGAINEAQFPALVDLP